MYLADSCLVKITRLQFTSDWFAWIIYWTVNAIRVAHRETYNSLVGGIYGNHSLWCEYYSRYSPTNISLESDSHESFTVVWVLFARLTLLRLPTEWFEQIIQYSVNAIRATHPVMTPYRVIRAYHLLYCDCYLRDSPTYDSLASDSLESFTTLRTLFPWLTNFWFASEWFVQIICPLVYNSLYCERYSCASLWDLRFPSEWFMGITHYGMYVICTYHPLMIP